MAAGRKNYELDIEILGKLDPSLLKAISETEAKLKQLGASGKTSSAVMSRVYSQAFDNVTKSAAKMESRSKTIFRNLTSEAGKAAHAIDHKLTGAFEHLGHTLLHVTGIGAALSAVGGAIGGAEILSKSVEIADERASMRATLETVLKSMGKENELTKTLSDLRQFTDYSPFLSATGTTAFSGLLANLQASGMLESHGGIAGGEKILHNVAEVASGGANPDQTFKDVMLHVNAAVGGGRVREGMITQIGQDIGGSIAPFVRKAIEQDPHATGALKALSDKLKGLESKGDKGLEMEAQAFEAFIKKKGNILPPEMLLEAFKIAAEDPNSPYYEHLESQAATPRGIKSTFKDKVADLEQAVGNIENGVLLPMLTAFNNFLSREKSTEIIKWSENLQEGLSKAMNALGADLGGGGIGEKLSALGGAFQSFGVAVFGPGSALGPLFKEQHINANETANVVTPEWQNRIQKLSDFINKSVTDITGIMTTITSHWNTIKDGMILVAAAWAGFKTINMATSIRDWLQKVGIMKGMTVNAGIVNVNGVGGKPGVVPGPANMGTLKAIGVGTFFAWLNSKVSGYDADPSTHPTGYNKQTGKYEWGTQAERVSQDTADAYARESANEAKKQNLLKIKQTIDEHNAGSSTIPNSDALKAAQETADKYKAASSEADKVKTDFSSVSTSGNATRTAMAALPGYAQQAAAAFQGIVASAAAAAKSAATPAPKSVIVNAPITVHGVASNDLHQVLKDHVSAISDAVQKHIAGEQAVSFA